MTRTSRPVDARGLRWGYKVRHGRSCTSLAMLATCHDVNTDRCSTYHCEKRISIFRDLNKKHGVDLRVNCQHVQSVGHPITYVGSFISFSEEVRFISITNEPTGHCYESIARQEPLQCSGMYVRGAVPFNKRSITISYDNDGKPWPSACFVSLRYRQHTCHYNNADQQRHKSDAQRELWMLLITLPYEFSNCPQSSWNLPAVMDGFGLSWSAFLLPLSFACAPSVRPVGDCAGTGRSLASCS